MQLPRQIRRRRFPLDIGVCGNNDLGDRAISEPGKQLADSQVFGADPTNRINRTAKNMVQATEFPSALDRDDIFGLFDHAQGGRIAPRVAAHIA
jgi:hypothetical protein